MASTTVRPSSWYVEWGFLPATAYDSTLWRVMPVHQTESHFHFWWLALLISALVFWQLCTTTSWLLTMCPKSPLVCAVGFPILTRRWPVVFFSMLLRYKVLSDRMKCGCCSGSGPPTADFSPFGAGFCFVVEIYN